jgi:hypothetical protein
LPNDAGAGPATGVTPIPKALIHVKVSHSKGKSTIDSDHPEKAVTHALLADLFATGDDTLSNGLLVQLAQVAQGEGELTAADLNMIIATIKAIGPRDPMEALLACQMAAIHKAMVNAARRFNRADMLPQYDSTGNQLNKLARTFAAQMEALKRYRSTGEQCIKVQHVTVNQGGQAIVGNVGTRGGGYGKYASQSHAPRESGENERGPALRSDEQAVWSVASRGSTPSHSRRGLSQAGGPSVRSPATTATTVCDS